MLLTFVNGVMVLCVERFIMDGNLEEIGERLRKARENAGFRFASDAAKALGVNYQTYSQHEQGRRSPHKFIGQYAKKFRVSVGWLLTGKDDESVKNHKASSTEPFDIIQKSETIDVPVLGPVRAGQWLELDEIEGAEINEYVPSIRGYPVDWQYAFSVEGESLNKTAQYGDRLVCVDLAKSGIKVEDGDFVIVERLKYGGQMIERTAKVLRQTAAGMELWPHSEDPRYQEPIIVHDDNTDEVRITAKVLWVVHKPR